MHLYGVNFFNCFCPFLFNVFLSPGVRRNGLLPACPSLICFLNKGSIEGTALISDLFDVCVCMFCFIFV